MTTAFLPALTVLLLPLAAAAQDYDAPEEAPRIVGEPAGVRPDAPPSAKLLDALRQTDRELQRTETGRRLLAQTVEVPILERRRTGALPVRYADAPARAIVVDADRAATLEAFDFESSFIRERRRAVARCPVPLFEDELAAHQEVLAYAVEKASVDPAFSRRLRAAYDRAERLFRSRQEQEAALRGKGLDALPAWRPPKDAVSLVGAELYLFSEDPYRLYAALEDALEWPAETVHLTELEDFLERYSARLETLDWRADGRYALLDGRPYSGKLARAALVVRGREGLARLREGLGPFSSLLREELRVKANRWIRESR